jgi:outer membrane protein assembly factor BamB
MTELYDPSVLLFDRGRFLIARDDGGEVQSLDGSTGKLAWRFSVEGELGERVLELPRSGGTLLVPAVFPEKTRAAEIAAWKRGTVDGEPLWRVTIEGLVRRKWIKQNSERLLLRATEKSDREYLVRLDRDSGEKLSRVQIPDIKHCVPGPADVYFCRSATSILALETPGGELVWESDLGSSRKRVHSVWWAGKWVAAESASKLYLLDAKSGEKVSSFPKKLDGARIDINDVLGPQGHQVYLVVKTFQESARLDRRYLVAIDGRTGKKVYEKRLGIPTSGRRDHRVRYDERDLGVPVIYLEPDGEKPARIFSAVGRLVRLINASDGEIVREFGMPGGKKRPTGLLSEDKGVALVERGKLLIAIDIEEARVLWRKHVPSQEVIHHHGREAFLEDIRGNLEWVSPAGSKPLPATLTKTMRSERPDLALANEGLFIARSGKKALFVDRETGKVENEIEGRWIFFYQGDLILGMRQLRRGGKPGVYVGLDIETGKTRWKRSVATEARSGTLPPTFSRERRWPVNWMAGAGGRFLITDSAGRCVTALDSGDGETVWTVCFSKLTGPPLSARGYLLVPARGPATMLAEGVAGPAGETSKKNGDRSALYAVRLRDGRVRRIFTGPEGKSLHLGTARPTSNGLLLATLSDPSSKMDELAALRLWREPRRIEKLGFAWPLSARAWQPLIPESMRGDRPDRKGR